MSDQLNYTVLKKRKKERKKMTPKLQTLKSTKKEEDGESSMEKKEQKIKTSYPPNTHTHSQSLPSHFLVLLHNLHIEPTQPQQFCQQRCEQKPALIGGSPGRGWPPSEMGPG